MADSLYDRYMKASAAYRVHVKACGRCSPSVARCTAGRELHTSFVRLQGAYLARLRRR
ncbi:hypothetical protein ACFXPM_19365 [Streptomyces sp. NPDC059095]|uniref:hypothetical protein n=1 Tax=Streptomyces sp. NPDC059095 TaxID=3346726 RepID=UPI0036AE8502